MKKSKIMQLGAMLAVMLLVSMALVPAVNGQGGKENKTYTAINGAEYTPKELKDLYSKHNITENDIKFAEDKLPNFLEGTILYGNTRVIASSTGKPPEGEKEGVGYNIIISIDEAIAIEEDAREKYIKKYGVDPANPKVEVVNGIPLPKEEAKRLFKNGKKDLTETEPMISILAAGPSNGPHAIDGLIIVKVFEAKDAGHKPTEPYISDTYDALYRFEPEYNVGMNVYFYFNHWDAGDADFDSGNVLQDLADDESVHQNAENVILLGWAHNLNTNGNSWEDWFYAVCSDTADGVDWPHDSIVQHETSHLFNGPEPKYGLHSECIMSYWWATITDIWCNSCSSIINENIWGN